MNSNYKQHTHFIWSLNLTLSGRCHHMDSVIDETHQQYAIDVLRSADALVLGRKTFELFADFWPHAQTNSELSEQTRQLAAALNGIPKYVVSGHALKVTWANCHRAENIPALRQHLEGLNQVIGLGSPSLLSKGLEAGLINELHVLIQPFIGVKEPSVFSSLEKRIELKLLQSQLLPEGSVLLRYSLLE